MVALDASAMEVEDADLEYENAVNLMKKDTTAAVTKLRDIVFNGASEDEGGRKLKTREKAIYHLATCLVELNRPDALRNLIKELNPVFQMCSKAKTAKIVRKVIDFLGRINGCTGMQADLCREVIQWCESEKRTMLRQRLESRLASYMLDLANYSEALSTINRLIKEVRNLDDKLLLVEIQLVESRIHLALENVPKAKAALTSARAASNAIYCPPSMQAEVDRQAGVLCSMENDFKTAFSYFYEAFESYNTINEPKQAVIVLKYMLLCKIMTSSTSDVYSIINGKAGVKYAGIDVEAMRAVAEAYKKRSLDAFKEVLLKYEAQLGDDPIIKKHIEGLYDNLLQQNLTRIIEPFSAVQITHVAALIDLPVDTIEAKLSEMILDKKLNGILDQGAGNLIVYDKIGSDKTYASAILTMKELDVVVDRLYEKARRLTHK